MFVEIPYEVAIAMMGESATFRKLVLDNRYSLVATAPVVAKVDVQGFTRYLYDNYSTNKIAAIKHVRDLYSDPIRRESIKLIAEEANIPDYDGSLAGAKKIVEFFMP